MGRQLDGKRLVVVEFLDVKEPAVVGMHDVK